MPREPAIVWPARPAPCSPGWVWSRLLCSSCSLRASFSLDAPPVRPPLLASFVIDLPEEWQILNESPAISPDSRDIVFSAWQAAPGAGPSGTGLLTPAPRGS